MFLINKNVIETRRGNQECMKSREPLAHKTQEEDKQNKEQKTTHTQHLKDEQHGITKKQRLTHVFAKSMHFLPPIRHPPCYSYIVNTCWTPLYANKYY